MLQNMLYNIFLFVFSGKYLPFISVVYITQLIVFFDTGTYFAVVNKIPIFVTVLINAIKLFYGLYYGY
jgi:hypothetical protein